MAKSDLTSLYLRTFGKLMALARYQAKSRDKLVNHFSQFTWCVVITRSRLQLINTLIDIFCSKLCAFLVEQRKRKASDGKKEAIRRSGRIFIGLKNL